MGSDGFAHFHGRAAGRLLAAAAVALGALVVAAPAAHAGPGLVVLHDFGGGADGDQLPPSPLVLGDDGDYYGTTTAHGANGNGTVFKVTSGGTFSTVYTFSASGSNGSNQDGARPGGLVKGSDGNFYGMTATGGASRFGTIYKLTPAGALSVLHTFENDGDAAGSLVAMVQGSDGNFYGVTNGNGGTTGYGSVFSITPAGTFNQLYSFSAPDASGINADGARPSGSLVQGSDGNFYGTTSQGGANGNGTVYKVTPGGAFSVVYTFKAAGDAAHPAAGLILAADGNFYGTAYDGAAAGLGAVYRITPAGAESVVYSFAAAGGDGQNPLGALVQGSDGNFYGTTAFGGQSQEGAIFRVTPAGVESVLYSFAALTDGAKPQGALIEGPDGNLYGSSFGYDESTPGAFGTVYQLQTQLPVAGEGEPTVDLSVTPQTITLGQSATLNWTSSNADSCSASGAWSGARATSGSQTETPEAAGQETFTLTCSRGESSVSASATLTVNPAAAPPPADSGVSGSAGAFGPGLLAPLGLLALLRRQRGRRWLAFLAAPLLAMAMAPAGLKADGLHPDFQNAYLGLRLGEGIYGQGASDLARDLAGQGDAVSGAHLQKHRFAGALYGGVPVWDGLGVEGGFVQLGKYDAYLTTSGNSSKVAADVAGKLRPAGQGITLGLGGLVPVAGPLCLSGHVGMLIYTSTQEAHSAAGTFKQTRRGVGAALATSAMYRFSGSVYGGVGVDAYIERGSLAVILPNAQIEYRFGPQGR